MTLDAALSTSAARISVPWGPSLQNPGAAMLSRGPALQRHRLLKLNHYIHHLGSRPGHV
jgi:hypothetical protein